MMMVVRQTTGSSKGLVYQYLMESSLCVRAYGLLTGYAPAMFWTDIIH